MIKIRSCRDKSSLRKNRIIIMKIILLPLTLSFTLFSSAQTLAADPAMSIEWNNLRPEQRQALDNFYHSIQQQQRLQPEITTQREIRMQHIEQLRDMTPEQRQQQFMEFVQQRQQQQLLLPKP